jgi:lysyl-tRNA synthetase class 2
LQQIAQRRRKLERLRSRGIDPYPARCTYDLEPAAVVETYGKLSNAELEAAGIALRVPGRVRAFREQGKVVFLDLYDGKQKLQVFIRKSEIDPQSFELLEDLDLGDYLLAEGKLLRTRTGELSIFAQRLELLSKALRPLPEKWHGLVDTEARYRQRYLDLVANPESRRVFEVRSQIVSEIRRFLEARGFMEVETPMMHIIPGGAAARPFITHHHAMDLDLYLRVAPELFLKRLLVGGIHRVYELNRNFRNEGISTRHNPEFTMLEFYWAYADYEQLMDLTEELLVELARKVLGEERLRYQGRTLELLPRPWPRWSMAEALVHLAGATVEEVSSVAGLQALALRRRLELPPELAAGSEPAFGHFLVWIFEELCEAQLEGPVFIVDHPVEVSPLAKPKKNAPGQAERFELYLGGMEVANAFSELNDPDLQAQRFREQLVDRGLSEEERMRFDADFIRALEHGMPPAGGEGIGIDRLTMLFTDRTSIRDVILFPLLRPEAETSDGEGGPRP